MLPLAVAYRPGQRHPVFVVAQDVVQLNPEVAPAQLSHTAEDREYGVTSHVIATQRAGARPVPHDIFAPELRDRRHVSLGKRLVPPPQQPNVRVLSHGTSPPYYVTGLLGHSAPRTGCPSNQNVNALRRRWH